jgi:hypothetical protein
MSVVILVRHDEEPGAATGPYWNTNTFQVSLAYSIHMKLRKDGVR